MCVTVCIGSPSQSHRFPIPSYLVISLLLIFFQKNGINSYSSVIYIPPPPVFQLLDVFCLRFLKIEVCMCINELLNGQHDEIKVSAPMPSAPYTISLLGLVPVVDLNPNNINNTSCAPYTFGLIYSIILLD